MSTSYQLQLLAFWLDFTKKKNNQLKYLVSATLCTARPNFPWTYEFVPLLNIFNQVTPEKVTIIFVLFSKPLFYENLLDTIFIQAFYNSLDFQCRENSL